MCRRISSTAAFIAVLGGWMFSVEPGFSQQLVGSFENSLSSPLGGTWEGPGLENPTYVTTGATDGSSALAIHHPTGWNIEAIFRGGMPLAQATAQHDFLLIDVTTSDLGVSGDGWSPSWRQLFVVFNSNDDYGGWQQNQFDVPVAPDAGGSQTETVILDLAASGIKANAQAYVDSGGGDGTWWELFLPMQGGDQGVVKAGDYSDNNLVDAADYVNWRKNEGGTFLTNETMSLGTVDQADYDEWRGQFGNNYDSITTIIDNVRFANAGSGALAAVGVPEPTTAWLALTATMALVAGRRSRR
jgi:hypothetical protein